MYYDGVLSDSDRITLFNQMKQFRNYWWFKIKHLQQYLIAITDDEKIQVQKKLFTLMF